MSKKPKHRRTITPKEDAESFGYIGLVGGFIATYIAAEAVLAARPHPYHWISAGVGAVVIGGGAYGLTLWQRRRHQPPR